MSAKHLQRLRMLQQQQRIPASNEECVSSGEDDSSGKEDEDQQPARLQFNPFSLIESEEDGHEASGTASDGSDSDTRSEAPKTSPAQPKPRRGGGGRLTKKEAKAAAAAAKADAAALGSGKPAPQQQMAFSRAEKHSRTLEEGQSVLSVNMKRLKGDDEMKRIFGAAVFAEEAREGARARGRGARGGGGGRSRAPLKGGLLVTPKAHWPPFSGGLSMSATPQHEHEEDSSIGGYGREEDGYHCIFQFEYSSQYRLTQLAYEEAQANNDVGAVAGVLQRTPYHADALLTMFDLHRSMGEHSQAEDMLQMALYGFEQAWHHSFNPAAADVAMDFDEAANRSFFLALFYHVQGLTRRGLHRTALEVGKLLLALDEDDPLGMTFFLDFLAVCAREHQFITRMCSWDAPGGVPLSTFPNWAFALALAARHALERPSISNPGDGGLPVWGGDGETYDPSPMLQRAVVSFPLAVQRLMAKLNDQGVGKGLEWQALLSDPFFADAADHSSATYSHTVDLFVERHHMLWKSAEVLEWLKQACQTVIAEKGFEGAAAADWAKVTAEVFPPNSSNQLRQLRLQDFSDNIATIPREEVEAGMRAQAMDAEAQQTQAALAAVAAQMERGHESGRRADGGVPIETSGLSTIELMMRSIMNDQDPEDEDTPVAPQERQELQMAGGQVMEQIGRRFRQAGDERRRAGAAERRDRD